MQLPVPERNDEKNSKIASGGGGDGGDGNGAADGSTEEWGTQPLRANFPADGSGRRRAISGTLGGARERASPERAGAQKRRARGVGCAP